MFEFATFAAQFEAALDTPAPGSLPTGLSESMHGAGVDGKQGDHAFGV